MHYIVNHSTVTPEQFAAMQADQAAIIEALDHLDRLATPAEVEAIRLARRRDPSLQNDPRFLRWFLRNESLFRP